MAISLSEKEEIFVTLTENSSVVTNDSLGPWKMSKPPKVPVETQSHCLR